jgi:hypothetical protein
MSLRGEAEAISLLLEIATPPSGARMTSDMGLLIKKSFNLARNS